jgi:hypothetical protein
MFIGEIAAVGIIEPGVVPESRPADPSAEPVTVTPSRFEEPGPAG